MTLVVEIHEFSTGIRYKNNSDESWVSLGFTGQYMNVTCDSIPHCVERSIANKEFAISEGASSDQPAIIGRVVLGGEEGNWSVVAVVNKGRDEMGRSASFYRFFLCQGGDKLPTILAWIKDREQLPVFNPAKTKSFSQAHSFYDVQVRGNIPRELVNSSVPILIRASKQDVFEHINALVTKLSDINALATQKANGQAISWAFNVEALEQPWKFLVIQAASDRAYQLLKKAIANPPKVRTPMVVDEQALTSALKSLISSSSVRPESLETFVEALANTDINQDYWEELFNSQGAINALRQNIYSSQMVRLLTLRTLAIPETLSQYLEWLKFDDNLNKRNLNQPIITSLQFQSQLLPLLKLFRESHQIDSKLTEILQHLKSYYSPFANLFEKIGDYVQAILSDKELATFYYKFSIYLGYPTNIPSKKLSRRAFSSQKSPQKLWNRTIHIYKKSKKKRDIVSKQNVFYLVILFFALGVILGGTGVYFLGKSSSSPSGSDSIESLDSQKSNSNDLNNSNTTGNNTKRNNQTITKLNIPGEKQQKAINKFETDSLKAIENIKTDIQESFPNLTEEKIIIALEQNLGDEKLNYNALSNRDDPQYEKYRNEWINAIYKYQENNNLGADGIISTQGKTIDLLKQTLSAKFNSSSNPVQTPESSPVTGE
ncbi:MAG: hypothetical protein QNJ55_25505 [Xenococcus sp. MO_188.B8]|nr:hypothetical protein [Xenococcus sp. MO_188.B8]